jgi:hypothetical protein
VLACPLVQGCGQRCCLRAACGQVLLGHEQQDQVPLGGEIGDVLGRDGPAAGPGGRRLLRRGAAAFSYGAIALDPGQDVVRVLGSVVQGQADEPRLLGQQADPPLFRAVELLQTCNDLPHIWPARQGSPAVVSWSPEHDPRVIPLRHALDDEQRSSGALQPSPA